MGRLILTFVVWAVAIACITFMRKYSPQDKAYPIWAVMVAIMFTAVSVLT